MIKKKIQSIDKPKITKKITGRRKSESTREMILTAARRVFAEHTYKAASLRMIARKGGFDHAIIRYHFPSKAILFEAVIIDACNKFHNAHLKCLEGLDKMKPQDGFPIYIERITDLSFKNQDELKLLLQNITHIDTPEGIPGYQHIPEFFSISMRSFKEKIPVKGSEEEIGMFLHSFTSLLLNYLGASACMARIQGLDPESVEYRKRVKDTFVFLFLPRLKKLIFPDRYSSDS